MSEHSKPVRLYQFYNFDVSESGVPFSLCDECIKRQPVPSNCELRKIAEYSGRECEGVG